MKTNQQMLYLGVIALLAECALHVPDDLRETIDSALDDAAVVVPGLVVERCLHRREVWFDDSERMPDQGAGVTTGEADHV